MHGQRTLGSPGFHEETRSYLQRRLRMLTGAVAVITGALALLFMVSTVATGERSAPLVLLDFATRFPNAALFWLVAGTAGLHTLLRRRRLGVVALAIVDGAFLQLLIVPCLLLYGTLHHFAFSGFSAAVPFLTLFILTRAVLVPSRAWQTALLSAPAAIGVLAIQLYYGDSFAFPDQAYGGSHFTDTLFQNQVVLVGAIAVATIASRVNLGLRRRTYDARRLGQYEIQSQIGEGGMGEVYLANHAMLKRPTAIKLLRTEIAGDAALRRFEKEVRNTSGLTHPNTVSIFDYGRTADGVFYYAMEYLEGATLAEVIAYGGPMPAARAIHVLSAACAALQEAHDKGLVHRDIKPANIMLCRQGGEPDVVKILDFGLVRDVELDDPEMRGMLMGTPQTMAPEAVHPETVGPRADLYSLGAVGYTLLTGDPVFEATEVAEYVRFHQTRQPQPPSQRVSSVPADLEAVVLKALQKDPAQRFRNANAMRDALMACDDAGTWTPQQAREWWTEFQPPARRTAVEVTGDSATLVIEDASLIEPASGG